MISTGLDIDRILHFDFMIKFSKFTDNIGSGNITDTFCQNIDRLKKVWGRWGGVVVLHPSVRPPPRLARPFWPREISRVTKFLLDRGAVAYAELLSTHYRRLPIMQGGLEIPSKITVNLHGTVKNHMLLDRYMQLVNALYCEPKEGVIMGSFLT